VTRFLFRQVIRSVFADAWKVTILLILGFGAAAPSTGPTMFGQTQQSTGLFGGGTSAFSASKPLFGTATTTAASSPFGGLSTAATGASLFNQNANKVCG
jgi:hypothetical protein